MIVLPVSKFCLDSSNSNPICSSNLSYVQDVEVEGGDSSAASADKGTTVEGMGAGPLLPARGIHGIFKALMPFMKKLKQPKHLDALQPSSAAEERTVLPFHDAGEDMEAEPALDDHVATVEVRGILYEGYRLYPFCSAQC